jgi:hypothetical protein
MRGDMRGAADASSTVPGGAPVFWVRDGAAPLGVGGLQAGASWVRMHSACEKLGFGDDRVGLDLENEIVGTAAPMKIVLGPEDS